MGPHQGSVEGKENLPRPAGHTLLLMHPRIPLAFLAARAHCWLMVNLSSTRTPRSLSAELLSSRSTPSLYWCMGLFLPRCRTVHLPLLNLIRFLSAQLSSLSRSRWLAAQPASVSTTPPSFVSSANLLRVHSNSSSRSLMKKLNKTGPITDPWVNISKMWSFDLGIDFVAANIQMERLSQTTRFGGNTSCTADF